MTRRELRAAAWARRGAVLPAPVLTAAQLRELTWRLMRHDTTGEWTAAGDVDDDGVAELLERTWDDADGAA